MFVILRFSSNYNAFCMSFDRVLLESFVDKQFIKHKIIMPIIRYSSPWTMAFVSSPVFILYRIAFNVKQRTGAQTGVFSPSQMLFHCMLIRICDDYECLYIIEQQQRTAFRHCRNAVLYRNHSFYFSSVRYSVATQPSQPLISTLLQYLPFFSTETLVPPRKLVMTSESPSAFVRRFSLTPFIIYIVEPEEVFSFLSALEEEEDFEEVLEEELEEDFEEEFLPVSPLFSSSGVSLL